MKRYWTDEELAEHWSLSTAELEILPDRGDHNRLGFAVLLKFIVSNWEGWLKPPPLGGSFSRFFVSLEA